MLTLCEGILQDIHSLHIHSRNPQSSVSFSDTSPLPQPSAPDRRPNIPSVEEGVAPSVSKPTCRLPPLLSYYKDTIRPDVGEADGPSSSPPAYEEENNVECEICCEEYPATEFILLEKCKHKFCQHCLQQHIKNSAKTGRGSKAPGCPYCGAEIHQTEVGFVLTFYTCRHSSKTC